MWKEFKEFIAQGSVMDAAIGFVLGLAFKAIIAGLPEQRRDDGGNNDHRNKCPNGRKGDDTKGKRIGPARQRGDEISPPQRHSNRQSINRQLVNCLSVNLGPRECDSPCRAQSRSDQHPSSCAICRQKPRSYWNRGRNPDRKDARPVLCAK